MWDALTEYAASDCAREAVDTLNHPREVGLGHPCCSSCSSCRCGRSWAYSRHASSHRWTGTRVFRSARGCGGGRFSGRHRREYILCCQVCAPLHTRLLPVLPLLCPLCGGLQPPAQGGLHGGGQEGEGEWLVVAAATHGERNLHGVTVDEAEPKSSCSKA